MTAARSEITVLDAVCQMFSKQRKQAREKAYGKPGPRDAWNSENAGSEDSYDWGRVAKRPVTGDE